MKVLSKIKTRNLKAPCSTCLGTCGPFCKVGGFSNVLQCTLFLLFCPQQSSGLMEGWIQVSFFPTVSTVFEYTRYYYMVFSVKVVYCDVNMFRKHALFNMQEFLSQKTDIIQNEKILPRICTQIQNMKSQYENTQEFENCWFQCIMKFIKSF